MAPYDVQLSNTPEAYRLAWGIRVVKQLERAVGAIQGSIVEVHAGSAYIDPIRAPLMSQGAMLVEPLAGLSMGARLAWYDQVSVDTSATSSATADRGDVEELITALTTEGTAISPAEFLATGGDNLRSPGLYSWWVDEAGADDLSSGLGQAVRPGLIYAGLAGATRSRSGRKSKNTLWGRIRSMHLGGRHEFSTFRLSLGSVLAEAHNDNEIDEVGLTAWMRDHRA